MDDGEFGKNDYENKAHDSGRASVSLVAESSQLVQHPVTAFNFKASRPAQTLGEDSRHSIYGSSVKRHYSYDSLGYTNKGIQEQGNREDSVLVLPVTSNNPTRNVFRKSGSSRFGQWKCGKCCTVSLCCWSAVFLIVLSVFWLGFIMIGNFPTMDEQNFTMYKNTMVLAARADPFWYSFVTITKEPDDKDHVVMNIYVVECDDVVVENEVIQYNRTLLLHQNVPLLDPTFLIDGSEFNIHIKILNASDNNGLFPRLLISNNANSIDDFKENKTISEKDITFVQYIENVSTTLNYIASASEYYYMGFMPTAEILVHVTYEILGFKYLTPSNPFSSCSTKKSGKSCNVRFPQSLTNINSDYYCVLCEMNSNPSYVDTYSVNFNVQVHRSLWNMFTIGILTLCLLTTSCGIALHSCYFIRSLIRRRKRAKYMSIQHE